MKVLLAFFCTLLSYGTVHAQDEGTHLAGRENKRPNPADYQTVADNDKPMDRAVNSAQHSLGFFVAALRAKKPEDGGFEIKKAFVDGDNVEHLWIDDVTFDGTNFHGRINNKPVVLHNVRLDQRVTVPAAEVVDWMFVKDSKLMGGYTTRVLYARMSPEEKARFDKEAEFKIE
ncbi:MAG: DUF2314 domain-containing protein [Rhodospirillales bacterium]|nr:DUF2314 domain-containing protein [Acetobacter sp.]